MNKAELVEHVAAAAGLTKKSAEEAVDAFLEGIKKGVAKKGGVQLVGFGSFSVASRKGRMGRNPKTGEPIKIKPSKTVKFRPGKEFKSKL
ncbi:MAG TPA: HU family DNA-binding protein [bacterium]|nr:HU family DNA-binding protein [bacterium]